MRLSVNYYGLYITVEVTHYAQVKPRGKWADSDWEAEGYQEIDYNILSIDGVNFTENNACNDDLDSVRLDSLVAKALVEHFEEIY